MHRFWTRFTGPIVETAKPTRILEIGAEFGWNTRNILDYCRRNGAQADIIDPVPRQELREILAAYPDEHAFHQARSIEVIPHLLSPDLVLLDGDHNWRTVFEELALLFARAEKAGHKEPIILLHDCAWPYARRDMYYNPGDFDEDERHPFAFLGMVPGEKGLSETGLNGWLANALQEGGPQNGVLTAVEDFIATSPVEIEFTVLPFFNGLGILIPAARMTAELRGLVESFFLPQSLLATCEALEADCMLVRVELERMKTLLTRRTEALERARRILEQQAPLVVRLQR